MTTTRELESSIGTDVVITEHGPDVVFRTYLVDRPAPSKNLRASESVLEVTIRVPHPVKKVWPIFKDFNLWMNRFGYVWDGFSAENENGFAYLSNRSNAHNYGKDGVRGTYVIRKVIPGKVLYFESFPIPIPDKDGVANGHTLMVLEEEDKGTKIYVFMEHTYYSETMSIEELRQDARKGVDVGLGFWRDYFIPDILSLLEIGKTTAT